MQSRQKLIVHCSTVNNLFQIKRKRVIILTFIACLGRGSMIVLLAASSISLAALQASINAPREAFRTCLKEATSKAGNEKVTADAYGAYVRTACTNELGSFKGAVVKFDMGNKMSKKASDEDAESMISDFVDSSLERYKYMSGGAGPAKQAASAPVAVAPTPPPPTPASAPTPPK
jgi:hypothetical protein